MKLKLVLGGEVRKFSNFPESFDMLLEIVSKLFRVKNVAFQYIDEEKDTITISSSEEYLETISSKCDLRLSIISAVRLVQNNWKFLEDNGFEKVDLNETFSHSESLSNSLISETGESEAENKDFEPAENENFELTENNLEGVMKNIISNLPINELNTPGLSCYSCQSVIDTKVSIIIEDQTSLLCEICQSKSSSSINLTISLNKLKELLNPPAKRESFCLIKITPPAQDPPLGKIESKNKPKAPFGEALTPRHPKSIRKFSNTDKEDILDKRRVSQSAIPKIRSFTLNDHPQLSSQQFEEALTHLSSLGFKDRPRNISALISCKYDMSKTIKLLSH